jgi:hypothetical protein
LNRIASWLACCGVLALAAFVARAQTPPTPQQSREANLKAYVELLRKDLKKDKVAIITQLMDFSPEQSAKFWPVYADFDRDLTLLADERLALLRLYAESYPAVTDEIASKIATGMLDVEGKRVELRKQYFQKFSAALSARDAAKWLWIEAQIEKLVDLQILANLPVVAPQPEVTAQ